MIDNVEVKSLFHRSRERIKSIGEVFTPEVYVNGMLNLLSQGENISWDDEDIIFFEPACGHGNIVVSIYTKRIEAFYQKALKEKIPKPAFYAVANAINTLWAIDTDSENILECRTRVLIVSINFLKKTVYLKEQALIKDNQDFICHLLCAITWQIYENETISALSNKGNAYVNACKTQIGREWYLKNKHLPLSFESTWASCFRKKIEKGRIPKIYQQAKKFVGTMFQTSRTVPDYFEFANFLIIKNDTKSNYYRNSCELVEEKKCIL